MRSIHLFLISFLALTQSGCGAGRLASLSADGELNEEYRLKHVYAECLKQSAKDGTDCTKIKQQLLSQQEWNAMDGGV